jgi:hypothetical protein
MMPRARSWLIFCGARARYLAPIVSAVSIEPLAKTPYLAALAPIAPAFRPERPSSSVRPESE